MFKRPVAPPEEIYLVIIIRPDGTEDWHGTHGNLADAVEHCRVDNLNHSADGLYIYRPYGRKGNLNHV